MKRLSLLVIFIISLSVSICSANIFPSQAIQQAEQFTSLIDNRNYHDAYQSSSDLLRLSTIESEWIFERGRSDKLVGHVLERKLVAVKARDSYPSLPDGDYLIVYYEARTEHKAKAAEVLLLSKNADRWAVCGYRLK
jgi:hypothetical protein